MSKVKLLIHGLFNELEMGEKKNCNVFASRSINKHLDLPDVFHFINKGCFWIFFLLLCN